MGGCGNRLFQITRAVDLSREGYRVSIIDIEDFPILYKIINIVNGWTKHSIWIDFDELAKKLNIRKLHNANFFITFLIYIELINIKIFKRAERLNTALLNDSRVCQIGYFQEKECLTSDSVEIVGSALHDALNIKETQMVDIVLHYRAGDFDDSHILEYEEVEIFLKYCNYECICITNDRKYVLNNFPRLKIHDGNSAVSDFKIIAKSSNIYPSDSTFCFWASLIANKFYNAKMYKIPESYYWNYINLIIKD